MSFHTRTKAMVGVSREMVGGWLVRSGDTEGFAGALTACAQRPDLRQRCGAGGRTLVRERYAVSRLVHDIEALSERLVPRCRY